jgi:hypothetical protein
MLLSLNRFIYLLIYFFCFSSLLYSNSPTLYKKRHSRLNKEKAKASWSKEIQESVKRSIDSFTLFTFFHSTHSCFFLKVRKKWNSTQLIPIQCSLLFLLHFNIHKNSRNEREREDRNEIKPSFPFWIIPNWWRFKREVSNKKIYFQC